MTSGVSPVYDLNGSNRLLTVPRHLRYHEARLSVSRVPYDGRIIRLRVSSHWAARALASSSHPQAPSISTSLTVIHVG